MRLDAAAVVAVSTIYLFSACGGGSPRDRSDASYSVSGTVHDPASGAGLAGVTVSLSGGSTDEQTTGLDGTFSFTDLAAGDYTVTPSKEGYVFSPASAPVTLSAGDQGGVDFAAAVVVPARHGISGTVRGSAAATVTLSGAASRSAAIDADGAFSFSDLDDGEYVVTPNGGSGLELFDPHDRTVTLAGADATGVDFAELHRISGYVGVRAMVLVSGVTVTATDGSGGRVGSGGEVQPDGTFAIDLVPPGVYTVTPSGEGYGFEPVSATVTVDEGDRTVSFIASYAPRSISGTVPGGPFVTVQADELHWAFTDAEGRYTIADLSHNTFYTVVARGFGYSVSPAYQYVSVGMANVTGVDFTASPVPSHSISGTVSGLTGLDLLTMPALADTPFPTYLPVYAYGPRIYPDGTYFFDDLPDWGYTIMPSLPGYTFSPETRYVNLTGADVTGIDFTGAAP